MATADRPEIDDDELIEVVRRPAGPMTEEEFVAWCDEDVQAEWADGEVIIMSPSSLRHVLIIQWLTRIMADYLDEFDLGIMLGPEFTVRLARERRRRVPDLLFVAKGRLGLLEINHLEGAPDLAIEIVSEDSKVRDRRDKYVDYEAAGVREYWIIDPDEEEWKAFSLDERGLYREDMPREGRRISTTIPGFFLRPEWLWQSPLPSKRAVLRELGLPE